MAEGIWFGTVGDARARMQWIKAPLTGMEAGSQGYSQEITFTNGGGDVVRSMDRQRVLQMSWNGSDADEYDIDEVIAYRNGEYGNGLIYVADPMVFRRNVLRNNAANPGLAELGYNQLFEGRPVSFVDTNFGVTNNPYRYPGRSAVFSFDDSQPLGWTQDFVVPVPPGYELWATWAGVYSGVGNATLTIIGGSPVGGSGVFNNPNSSSNQWTTGSGNFTSGYAVVRVTVNGIGSGQTSQLTLTSIRAVLVKNANLPNSEHVHGQGFGGMKFQGDTVPYTYTMVDRRVRSLSATLVEVEEWL